jgi:NADPH:quinone reductase-like Zn-dependent oxidoreductase
MILMRAIAVEAFETGPDLIELPAPQLAANEVLVRVATSSVNPVDHAIASGMLKDMAEHELPIVLGRDYAGVIELVGTDVTRLAVGDKVFGFVVYANPVVHDGAWAEHIAVAEADGIAKLPALIELSAAGAAPVAGITACLAVDALGLSEGQIVLIVGAAGGVGSLAVQLAARPGAVIIAPGLPDDEDYLRDLGASHVVPRDGDVVAAARELAPGGVDALLDLVSYAPGAYDAALKAGARVVSPNGAAGEGAGRTDVMATPTHKNLERVGRLLATGALRVPIHDTVELERAPQALNRLRTEHTQGKLGIRVDA